MILPVKGSAAPAVRRRASACGVPSFDRNSAGDSRSSVAFVTLNVLTTMAQYDSVLLTTPSTPIHDAHQ